MDQVRQVERSGGTGATVEREAARLVDRSSPPLLQLAGAFAPDASVAQRMVVRAWRVLLERDGLPDPQDLRCALVRALGAGDPDDPAVAAAARELRLAVRGAGCWLPRQSPPGRALPAGAPAGTPAERLRALPGALRLVVLLSDVQRWPAEEVEHLLEVRPAARRALLAQARGLLCPLAPTGTA